MEKEKEKRTPNDKWPTEFAPPRLSVYGQVGTEKVIETGGQEKTDSQPASLPGGMFVRKLATNRRKHAENEEAEGETEKLRKTSASGVRVGRHDSLEPSKDPDKLFE